MGNVSKALSLFVCLILASFVEAQDAPEMVVGTEEGKYKLFTPADVVKAGGGGGPNSIPLSSTVPLIESGSGAVGAAATASRGDHVHPAQAIPRLGQAKPKIEGTAAAGIATAASREDHIHPADNSGGVTALSDATPYIEGTANSGTSTRASRGDHIHPLSPLRALSNSDPLIEGTADPGSSTRASRADHVHPEDGGGGGSTTPLSNATPHIELGAGKPGTSSSASRGDHIHPANLGNATPALAQFEGNPGSGLLSSREDHVHPAQDIAGNIANVYNDFKQLNYAAGFPDTTPARVPAGGSLDIANLIERARTSTSHPPKLMQVILDKLEAGPAFAKMNGIIYARPVAPAQQCSGQVADTCKFTVNISLKIAALPFVRSRTIPLFSQDYRYAAARNTIIVDLGDIQKIPLISSTDLIREPSGYRFTFEISLSLSGVRVNYTRSITWSELQFTVYQLAQQVNPGPPVNLSDAVPKIEAGTGTAGTDDKGSRSDHVHPADESGTRFSTNIPKVEGGSGAVGVEAAASRGDHIHPAAGGGADLPTGLVPVGSPGQCLKSKTAGADGTLDYADCGSPRVLSNRNPLIEGTANPGNRTDVSRADHVHPTGGGGGGGTATPLSDVKPLVEGTADPGTASAASRGDHVHPARALPADELPAVTGNAGKPLRVKADASGPEWVDPHVLTLSGLPAITGHGGNVLAVNTGATALEWKAAGGGGTSTLAPGATRYRFSVNNNGGSSSSVNFATGNVATCTSLRTALIEGGIWISFEYTVEPADASTNIWAGSNLIWIPENKFTGVAADKFLFYGQIFRDAGTYTQFQFGFPSNTNCTLTGARNTFYTHNYTFNLDVNVLTIAGSGGGGSTGPTIPTPTVAGALKHLRVAAGGNGYELAAPPEGVPARGAGTVDRYKVLGMNSDGQTLRWADSSDIVGFGLQDISGLEGKCLVAGGTATAADGGESIAEWVDCITDDDVPELERDIDGLQALTGDLLLGRAEPGPSYVLNSVDKAGGLAWISGSSITPNLQGVTFQTNTVPRPGAGWGVGSMIIRIIDSEDVRMWQQRDSLPGADNVDISHWPGNQWREITPTNATAGYKYYLGHSPPNTSNVTQARLFRTNTSAHFGETEYYGKTPLVDAEIAKLDKEVLLWTQGFANLSDLEPSNNTAVSIGPNPSTAIRTAQLSRDPFRQFRLLIEFVDTVQDATPRSGYLQGWMAGAATGEPIANTETAKYYGALFDSRGTAQYIWLDSKNTGGSNLWVSTGTVTGDASNPAVTASLYGYR